MFTQSHTTSFFSCFLSIQTPIDGSLHPGGGGGVGEGVGGSLQLFTQ